MSIRSKLIFWFLVAALLPAVVIVFFAAGEAERRFNSRALDELAAAQEGATLLLEELKSEVGEELINALESSSFQDFYQIHLQSNETADHTFARSFNNEIGRSFDYLTFLDADGTVLSSYEWELFAGIRSWEWDQIKAIKSGTTFIGPVEVDGVRRIAIRNIQSRDGMIIIGGRAVGNWILPRFRTSAYTLVFLNDSISGRVLAEQNQQESLAEKLELALSERSGNQQSGLLLLDNAKYLYAKMSLVEEDPALGSIIFLYPRAELDDEIGGLWTTFMFAATVGVLLALILGAVISTRFSSPLRDLIYGFDLIALGDFSHRFQAVRSDELGDILKSYNRMGEDLENLRRQLIRSERLAAWQEIARKIAHEIKNPLSPIQISIETLQKVYERRHPEFEQIFRESTTTILEEVDKIRTIVQEFSDFARMPEPSFESTDLATVVEKAVRLFKPQLANVLLDLKVEDGLKIIADPEQLHRALVNLLANALDALNGSGRIIVSLSRISGGSKARRGYARIRIIDDGPGISEEDLKNIFTPYFTTKIDGTGLGLVIVQKIVEQHKGRLVFRSTPGSGTRVDIVLPLLRA